MIIVRTPFRVSFVGGGSDLEEFYTRRKGAVVSTSINKYMYIMIHPYFYDKIRIKYSKTEDVNSIGEIQHPLVRECLRLVAISKGIEIASIADVPAGTGLGSSSAFTVGLLQALHTFTGKFVTKERLAQEACKIEIDILKEPIGKQDQYAVSYGGLNFIEFNKDGTTDVHPIPITKEVKNKLESRLSLFFVGNIRNSSDILREQRNKIENNDTYINKIERMVVLAGALRQAFLQGKLDHFGEILHEAWMIKRGLSSQITSPLIDKYYAKARKAGAMGGKILGAGGGGFLLICSLPKYKAKIQKVLGLRKLDFGLDIEGTKVISTDNFYEPRS